MNPQPRSFRSATRSRRHRIGALPLLIAAALFAGHSAWAQDPGPSPDDLSAVFPKAPYSPFANRDFPTRPLWGDTHLHTGLSMDAGAFGARLMPDDAYKFARGEEIVSSTGQRVRLARPLDFLVVADHSDNMGFFPLPLRPEIPEFPGGIRNRTSLVRDDPAGRARKAVQVAVEVIQGFSRGHLPRGPLVDFPEAPRIAPRGSRRSNAAEDANDPRPVHRVHRLGVDLEHEGQQPAPRPDLPRRRRTRPAGSSRTRPSSRSAPTTRSTSGSGCRTTWTRPAATGPRDRPQRQSQQRHHVPGRRVLQRAQGRKIGIRMRRPAPAGSRSTKSTQIKGDGEAHPFLSPNDEFADYETWDKGNLDLSVPKKDDMLQYEYARSALKMGSNSSQARCQPLQVRDDRLDRLSHTGSRTAEEDNFFGKHSGAEPKCRPHGAPDGIETEQQWPVRRLGAWSPPATRPSGRRRTRASRSSTR